MSASVWQLSIRDSGLAPTQRHLLRVVGEFSGDPDGWPTTRQVQESMGVCEATVWNHLTVLRDQGWLIDDGYPRRWRPAVRADQMAVFMSEAG
jgi:DNA-binding IclR family transcriptional regulator